MKAMLAIILMLILVVIQLPFYIVGLFIEVVWRPFHAGRWRYDQVIRFMENNL